MRFRPPLADHPWLGALSTVIVGLLIFGVGMPWLSHEQPNWPAAIFSSVLLGIYTYVARTGTARFQAYFLAGIGVIGLLVYGSVTIANGIPEHRSERLAWAFVVALPVLCLVLAWIIYRRAPGRK
ncbi:MAG: hypothetical protein ACR2MQ_08900 [Gemmatimonadaceae bacterium]